MCWRRGRGCYMPDWLRDYEARTCSILCILSFSCAITSFAVFTDSAVQSLTVALKPALCTVAKSEDLYGLTNCEWTSCRGSCTALFYNCTQIMVSYSLTHNDTSFFSNTSKEELEMLNTPDPYGSVNPPKTDNLVPYNAAHINLIENKSSTSGQDNTDTLSDVNSSEDHKLILLNRLYIKRKFTKVNESSDFSDTTPFTRNETVNDSLSVSRYMSNNSSFEEDDSALISGKDELHENENSDFLSFNSSYVDFNTTSNSSSMIPLYVNIFGCGYEPDELCETFFANYTHVGMEFQCLIKFGGDVFAVPDPEDYDFTKFKDPMRSLLLSLIPLGICVFSACYIRVRKLHRMRPKESPKPKRRFMNSKVANDEEKETLVPKMTNKNPPPAFIKVTTPSPVSVENNQHIDREQFL